MPKTPEGSKSKQSKPQTRAKPGPKRRSSSSASWLRKADTLLDSAERGVQGAPRSAAALADAVGVSRQTIWRNTGLRERLAKLSANESGEIKPQSLRGRVASLALEIEAARALNERLVRTLLVIARRLEERDLPVEEIMGSAIENPVNPLPWDDE